MEIETRTRASERILAMEPEDRMYGSGRRPLDYCILRPVCSPVACGSGSGSGSPVSTLLCLPHHQTLRLVPEYSSSYGTEQE